MFFSEKVVLVTGASGGIGAAIAIAFAQNNANVVLVARNESKLKGVADKCQNKTNRVHIIKADISIDEQAKKTVDETIETFGKLDVLVNNAGKGNFGRLLDGKIMQSFDDIMNLNLRAHVYITSLAAPRLIKTKGNIINISSVTGSSVPPKPKYLSYYVSKAALNQFTRCAAAELATHGVRVNAVSPGPVKTDILANIDTSDEDSEVLKTALGTISTPEEVADLVLFIASEKAKSITGADYVIDNGCLLVNPRV